MALCLDEMKRLQVLIRLAHFREIACAKKFS